MESQENTGAAAHDSKYRVDAHLDIPEFKATIPSHLMEGMKGHDKFLLEQISVMKNQNQWQTDMVYKIYNYTKTINGKVVDLEHFRHRMMIEHELDDKYAEREKEVGKWKKWGLILFVGLLYPIYLTVMNHAGIGKVLENLMKL
jgi:hypothetical protein